MPRYPKKSRKTTKKTYKRRPKIARSFNPLPDKLRVKLSYVQNFGFTGTTSAHRQIMRGNSIFDPDYTNTLVGHQPLYRDQYSALFNKYCVLGSTITCTVVCPNAGQSIQFVILPQPDDITTGATIDIDSEKPRAKTIFVNGGGDPKKLTHKISSGRIFGEKITAYSREDSYESIYSGNPNNVWYWIMSAQCPDMTTTAYCSVMCKMTYDVILFDKIRQSQS